MAEKKQKVIKTLALVEYEKLPPDMADYPRLTEDTLAVVVTYRRVVGRSKNSEGRMEPHYGGAMAHYPKETGFKLDREGLLGSVT